MDYNQYVKLVKERVLFSADADAVRSIRAVLEVLSERLSADEADNLRALLPKELKPYLSSEGQAVSFGMNEFLARIGAREGVDASIARYHAQAVLSVLASAVPADGTDRCLVTVARRNPRTVHG